MSKFFSKFVFKAIFFISLESSETHFDLVACKIGLKRSNLVIYGDILVNFLRILTLTTALCEHEPETLTSDTR